MSAVPVAPQFTLLDQLRSGREVLRLEGEALVDLSRRLDPSFCSAVDLVASCEGSIVELVYLKNQNIDKANLTLVQDDNQIYIQLVSDMKDSNKADTAASGINTAIQAAVLLDANGIKKLDESSKILIKNAKVTSDGKNFVLTVAIPKADAQAMIDKTLKDRAEKKKQTAKQ